MYFIRLWFKAIKNLIEIFIQIYRLNIQHKYEK